MFFIYGNLNFVPGGYDPWIAAYEELEKYVRANEPESCLTYYFGTPEEYQGQHSRSTQMLAFEQYRVRADLYDIHFHSKAMDVFLSKIPPTMTTGLDLTHYEDAAGFLDKPGNMTECGVFYDTRITCAAGERAVVLAKLADVATHVERDEPGTYTFLVLRSLDTEDGVRVFERYESRAAMETHWKGPALLAFFMATKELIKSMEGRSYVPNGDLLAVDAVTAGADGQGGDGQGGGALELLGSCLTAACDLHHNHCFSSRRKSDLQFVGSSRILAADDTAAPQTAGGPRT